MSHYNLTTVPQTSTRVRLAVFFNGRKVEVEADDRASADRLAAFVAQGYTYTTEEMPCR